MALGEYRQVLATDINFVVNAAAERGGILSAASGNIASYVASVVASGTTPIGILLDDVESLNPMLHPQYYQRNVTDIGGKVGIATQGEFITDFLDPDAEVHIDAGDRAYLQNSGLLTIRALAPGVVGSAGGSGVGIVVGRFLSSVDSNGFAKVWIDL